MAINSIVIHQPHLISHSSRSLKRSTSIQKGRQASSDMSKAPFWAKEALLKCTKSAIWSSITPKQSRLYRKVRSQSHERSRSCKVRSRFIDRCTIQTLSSLRTSLKTTKTSTSSWSCAAIQLLMSRSKDEND